MGTYSPRQANAEILTSRFSLIDGIALRYLGYITGELPRQFAGKKADDISVNGRRSGLAIEMELHEPTLDDRVFTKTEIFIPRRAEAPYTVASLSIDRSTIDHSSMTHAVPDYHEYFVMGASNNDLSLMDAILSVRRAISAIQE